MAEFKHHEPCPACGSRDNLARYTDGSAWCFGCRYYEPPSNFRGIDRDNEQQPKPIQQITLTKEFPGHVLAWLAKYEITVQDCFKYGFRYNPERDQLVFSWYDESGNLLGYCARNFAEGSKRKYFTQGNINDLLPIYHNESSDKLVLVEDVISAVKLCNIGYNSMPCLSSSVPTEKLARIAKLFRKVNVWLTA